MFRALLDLVRSYGLRAAAGEAAQRILHYSAASFLENRDGFRGKQGLEIGGPTARFRTSGLFPVYPLAASIDNCNFSSKTVWEGAIKEGKTFFYGSSEEIVGRLRF